MDTAIAGIIGLGSIPCTQRLLLDKLNNHWFMCLNMSWKGQRLGGLSALRQAPSTTYGQAYIVCSEKNAQNVRQAPNSSATKSESAPNELIKPIFMRDAMITNKLR